MEERLPVPHHAVFEKLDNVFDYFYRFTQEREKHLESAGLTGAFEEKTQWRRAEEKMKQAAPFWADTKRESDSLEQKLEENGLSVFGEMIHAFFELPVKGQRLVNRLGDQIENEGAALSPLSQKLTSTLLENLSHEVAQELTGRYSILHSGFAVHGLRFKDLGPKEKEIIQRGSSQEEFDSSLELLTSIFADKDDPKTYNSKLLRGFKEYAANRFFRTSKESTS